MVVISFILAQEQTYLFKNVILFSPERIDKRETKGKGYAYPSKLEQPPNRSPLPRQSQQPSVMLKGRIRRFIHVG